MKERLEKISEKVIVRKMSGGYREYRIPGILCMQNAAFLAYEARAEAAGDWGDIDVVVSRMEKDGSIKEMLKIGKSHLPKDGTMRTYNNPTLIPDGERIHMIFHINYERAFIVTSEDRGETWTKPQEITAAYQEAKFNWNVCATGPGHGIQTKSGRLVVPIWLANGKVHEDGLTRDHWPSVAGCIYSDDHAKTWHFGLTTEGICDANETSVTELPDGNLLFNFRNRNEEKRRVLGISKDGGESIEKYWMPEALIDPMCFGAVATAPDGTVLFANCNSQHKRVDLTLKASADAGKSWKSVWGIDPVSGYADLAVDNGRAYVFYERLSYKNNIIEELVLAQSDILCE